MGLRRTMFFALVVFVIDRISKIWVLGFLDLDNRYEIEVLPPFLNLRMAWNTGINFGLFGAGEGWGRLILVALALLVVTALAFWARGLKGWVQPMLAGAVIGGALGNVFDRLWYGAVADFLNMSCCGIANPWAFNIADVAIFAGAIGLVLFGSKAKVKG